MKIAQIVSTFPPYRGGMGNVAYYITDQLSQLKYNVTVFTPRQSKMDKDFTSFFKIFHLIPQFRFGNAAVVMQLVFRCWKFDVIHFHFPFIGAALPVALLKLLKGHKIKLIVHYHMDLVGRSWKKIIFKIYKKFILKLTISVADKVIVTSMDYAQESLIASYISKTPQKFFEIYNGVDVNFFQPKTRSFLLTQKYKLENKKVILFVGALDSAHYFKGINYLIKAFELLHRDDVKLVIVGEGDLKHVYQDLADSYRLSEQIIFTGYVPDKALVDYYNLSDIFVLPSIDKSEAFGVVLIEAMACAKPVVASNLPGVRNVVTKKVDGRLVKPKDAEGLAEQIKYLLENKNDAFKYGQAGRKKVEENYSWPRIVDQIIKLY